MTSPVFYVQTAYEADNGLPGTVAATFLQVDGSFVTDPNPSNAPLYADQTGTTRVDNPFNYYVVPVSFNTSSLDAFDSDINSTLNEPDPDGTGAPIASALLQFKQAFQAGGAEDLQRNYDGNTWNGDPGTIVPAFQSAASYAFGYAAEQNGMGVAPGTLAAEYNAIETTGGPLPSTDVASIDKGARDAFNTASPPSGANLAENALLDVAKLLMTPAGAAGAAAGSLAFLAAATVGLPVLGAVAAGSLIDYAVTYAVQRFLFASTDPLVMSVSGGPLDFVALNQSSVYFDYTGSGIGQQTSWIGDGAGFLVKVGADGLVSDGSNLITSFAQLESFDTNQDGLIDGAELASIDVWQDLNGDGVCEVGEVQSLAQLGVVSISLTTQETYQELVGATIVQTAVATMADGTTREIAAADLNVSNVITNYVGAFTVTAEIASLPNLKGYGLLPDLRIAMSQNASLEDLVGTLAASNPSNTADYDAALQAVLYQWAGVESTNLASGGTFDGQKLGFLENYLGLNGGFGGGHVAAPWLSGQANLLQESWNSIFASLKARLLVQTPGSVFAQNFTFDPSSLDLIVPTASYPQAIAALSVAAPTSGDAQVSYWTNALMVVNASVADVNQYLAIPTDVIAANLQAVLPTLFSTEIINAAAAGSLLFIDGTELNANFVGSSGSDLFQVSDPNSLLTGLGGGDEFIIGTGLGTTEIYEADNASTADNVLLLTGVDPAGVTASSEADGSIVLTLSDGSTVKLDDMLVHPDTAWEQAEAHAVIQLGAETQYGVERVVFTDGTTWTSSQLVQMAETGTTGADKIYGTDGADVIDGQGGGDYEQGNGGGDTFVYQAGYGQLEINEVDTSTSPDNTLSLGSSLTPSNVSFTSDRSGDLILTDDTSGDRVQVDSMLLSPAEGVQSIAFSDGTTWSLEQVRAMLAVGSASNTALFDAEGGITLDPSGYAHLVTAEGGSDTIVFDQGYGLVEVDAQNANAANVDTLRLGPGITAADVTVGGDGKGNIVLTVGNDGDVVQLDGMLLSSSDGVQQVTFADGTTWSASYLISLVPPSEDNGTYYQTISYDVGDEVTVAQVYGSGEVDLGSDIDLDHTYVQVNASGDLVVKLRDNPTATLTLEGDLYGSTAGYSSRIGKLVFANGSELDLSSGFAATSIGSASNHVLTGAVGLNNVFDLGPGGDQVTAGNLGNTFVFGAGDGHSTVVLNGGTGIVQMEAGLVASDVSVESTASGDLIVQILATGETITFKNDLSGTASGVSSQISAITFSDGSSIGLAGSSGPTFSWVGVGSGAPIDGSDYGSNTFIVGPGNATIIAGNGSDGGSDTASRQNTLFFDKGDGQATVDMNGGVGTLTLGSDIAASDIVVQADNSGDLTVSLRDDRSDSITFTDDLVGSQSGVASALTTINLGDGSSVDLSSSAGPTSSWTGTSTDMTLIGSDYGANNFVLGAGGDTVILGNGLAGGSNANTVIYAVGDGAATIDLNGGNAILQLGPGISASELTFQADDAGDLTVFDGTTGDSIVIDDDLYTTQSGVQSRLGSLNLADGTTVALTAGLTFTWKAPAAGTSLTGSGYGANVFYPTNGGDKITLGNGADGGSTSNKVVYVAGDGATTIDLNGENPTLVFGPGITEDDLTFQASDGDGNLTIFDGTSGDSIVVEHDLSTSNSQTLSQLTTLDFADGSSQTIATGLMFSWTGSALDPNLIGSSLGPNTYIVPGGDPETITLETSSDIVEYYGGLAIINLNSGDALIKFMMPQITAGNLTFQADDATGDLTIFDGTGGESIVIKGDLYDQYGTARGYLQTVEFNDGTLQPGGGISGGTTENISQDFTFTWTATATTTSLTGSGYGANVFNLAPGGDNVTLGNGSRGGSLNNTVNYGSGDGLVTVNLNNDYATIAFGIGITAGDLTFQVQDSTGTLTIFDGTLGDSIVIAGDIYDAYGNPTSHTSLIEFADGTSDWLNSGMTFTWTATSSSTNLTGSGYGANVFNLAPGGDTVLLGNGDYGGSTTNTVNYAAGDGAATIYAINTWGNSTLVFGAGITAADLIFQADDSTNDLTILDGTAGDSIVIDNDLNYSWRGVGVGVPVLEFSDGTSVNLDNGMTFTWTGTATDTTLTGSGYGANVFNLAAGGDTVLLGNGDNGGSTTNTVNYAAGDGAATIYAINTWGTSTLVFGAGVVAADLTFQADDKNGNLTILDGTTGDSIVIDNDLNYSWRGVGVGVPELQFSDGTSENLDNGMTFTWTGTATTTSLTGSGYGANVFNLAPGGDTVLLGNGDNGGSTTNVVNYSTGDGAATIYAINTWGNSTLVFGPGITAGDLILQANDSSGDLTILDGTSGDSIIIDNDLSYSWRGVGVGVPVLQFSDGTSENLSNGMTFTWTGTAADTSLVGSGYGANVFDLAPGGDTVLVGNGDNGGSANNTVNYAAGDGAVTIYAINSWGNSALSFGPGITFKDLVFQADDGTGNLTILDGITGDSIVIKNDLTHSGENIGIGVPVLKFGDGTSENLLGGITFTWTATADDSVLVGSGYGANVFYLAPGGDTVTLGTGSGGGSQANTVYYGAGDGVVVINPYGTYGPNSIVFGSGITASDLTFQADDGTGDLTILDGATGDKIVLLGDLFARINIWLGNLAFSDGTTENLNNGMTFTWTGTTADTNLVGSGYGANIFDLAPGGDVVTLGNGSHGGSQNNIVNYSVGDGAVTINAVDSWGSSELNFGVGVTAADLTFQADDSTGDLTIMDGTTGDSIVIQGDLSHGEGWSAGLGVINFSDGTSYTLNRGTTFTSTATATNTVLVGSGYGANVFNLAPGGDRITLGNGAEGGSQANTVNYAAGDGAVTISAIDTWGTSTLVFGPGIAASDLTFQANDSTGDLTILDGRAGDVVVVKGDLSHVEGWSAGLRTLDLSDGTSETLSSGMTFTSDATATNTILVGSGYGANVFNLAPGGDAVTLGNGADGGSQANTVNYAAGDGRVTINAVNAWGTSEIVFGAGLTASDLTFQADDSTGDLTISDGTVGDSIVIQGDFSHVEGWSVGLGTLDFSDGTSEALNSGMTFTWTATLTNTVLTGSGYGANVFNLAPGSDNVTFGDGSGGGSSINTASCNAGDGAATINENGGSGTINLGSGIDIADLDAAWSSTGNLVLSDTSTGDVLTIANPSNSVAIIGDYAGISSTLLVANPSTSSLDGTAGNEVFAGLGNATYEQGDGGSDTFLFQEGNGHLEINQAGVGSSTLVLGVGVNPADITLTPSGSNLQITDAVSSDYIQLDNELQGSGYGVGQMAFSNGTSWSQSQLQFLASIQTSGASTVVGTSGDDVLGTTASGATLQGSGGNDTYLYNASNGSMIIDNSSSAGAPAGSLLFGSGINEDDLWFGQSGNDLLIQVLNSSEVVDIKNWFGGDMSAELSNIVSSDGLRLTSGLNPLMSAMAQYQAANPSFSPSTSAMPTDKSLQAALMAAWHT